MLEFRRMICLAAGFVLAATLSRAQAAETYLTKSASELPDADRIPTGRLAPDAEHAFPLDRPILTILHYSTEKNPKHIAIEKAMPFMKRAGVTHVWGWPPEEPGPFRKVHLTNLAYQHVRAKSEDEWMYVFLKTPWKTRGDTPLEFDLLAHYLPKRFLVPKSVDKALAFRVEDRKAGGFLPTDAFTVDAGKARLRLTGGEAGREYRAIFLAGDKGFNLIKGKMIDRAHLRMTDGTVPSAKRRQFDWLESFMKDHSDIAVIRPTSEIYDRAYKIGNPDDNGPDAVRVYARQAYWQGMNPERLARFEETYGRPFDPRWVLDHAFGESGYPPETGYRQWVDLIRNDLGVYVRERNNLVHEHGKRVRVFYGDNFVGVEPYLGDIEQNGYDEVVMGMDSGPGLVRFMTGFPGEARRITRFPWSDQGRLEERVYHFRTCWRWMKRESLFHCQDGFTMGGLGTKMAGTVLEDEAVRIFRDFEKIFDRVHGKNVFTHDGFNVTILTAWGRMRSWKVHSHYLSQNGLNGHLLDMPVNVQWRSFDEVIEQGVPEDTAVVILNGEPGTAWAGGRYWRNTTLQERIREFVREGGGLLALGAPTLVDGEFALSDVLGVEYAGAPNEDCAAELWNVTRWTLSGRAPDAYPLGGVCPLAKIYPNPYDMPETLRGRFDEQGRFWTVRYPAQARATSATVLAHESFEDVGDGAPAWRFHYFKDRSIEQSKTGVFVHEFGKGRAVTIGGWGDIYSLFKPLLFYAANRMEDLDRVHSGDPQVAVYFYPETNLLIAYNHSARAKTTHVRFDPTLAGVADGPVALRSLDSEIGSVETTCEQARAGFPVTLASGQAAYWTVDRSMRRSP